jgi:formylglycine-generating enzyme required for sulfatase activity
MKPLLSFLLLFASVSSAPAITIETVPIGDIGNPNDPATGNLYGGVSYAYNIGKYEVTVGQYTAFLNAVAATDTYGLYYSGMASNANIAGILHSGSSGTYTYSVIGSPNHPVTYVSWGDAARFTNWLHNGQPTGPQDNTTTEDGAYALNGANSNAALITVARKATAKWFIPTENEWYKAAYYQPATQGGDADNYWTYPMRTNSPPHSSPPPGATPDNTRVGNFYEPASSAVGYDNGYAVTSTTAYDPVQNYLTDVGAYTSSPSFYGTFDQGGNVWEWDEAVLGGTARGIRGGAWLNDSSQIRANYRNSGFFPTVANEYIGFRVATVVPEPSTILLLAIGSLVALGSRKGR